MMKALKQTLIGLRVPPENIKIEAFGTNKRNPNRLSNQNSKELGKIKFLNSNKSATAREGVVLLDTADQAGVQIDSACRSGTCGACIVKLKRGEVQMEVDDALTKEENADGYILACQAEPKGDVELEALAERILKIQQKLWLQSRYRMITES